MKAEIRKAAAEDLDLLLKWRMEVLREVFSIPKDQSIEDLEKENRQYYQKTLQTGEHIACFAFIDEQIVGCGGVCFYQEMPSPDNPTGTCAYFMNIYTRPLYRKRGVGEAIITWLMEQAMQRGASKLYLETSEAGEKLYQKMGFLPMQGMLKLPNRKIK
ncbi:MAG TPA: GNAT family N-acetyltransferase [Candidatus Anaerostipes excrementavium]|uniref:GNAT family N-acetyltransferase n=1 Tax=Candidatus Anaerostipes excrementavium TaxID=2838463 RepID=A0A9D2B8F1_9FIRM|nr:GNAT family N-acetyltransferase [uncultured Anaerostipes sp.]HIX66881.1 GNAT family N-acetyltransferase [Candidatus Anaerostipes excrementavium]